ncbi:hypothetical protein [Govanella unica]|uniref:Uncharacterized protein n=1 Tax=Govanella unica TaxID=2975056 RepID=A0A9X3Z724_9PROT|nr:hypothetical protein [Govania unica]MDA5193726.1 hypothetical protein [Govania unica]
MAFKLENPATLSDRPLETLTNAEQSTLRTNHEACPGTAWRDRLSGTNINPDTLLATDYLNHFNEAVMILDLVAEMPDCLEDIIDWAPKSYQEHFAHSHFQHKALAVEAYAHAPAARRAALEAVIDDLNLLILCTISEAAVGLSEGAPDTIHATVSAAASQLRELIAKASRIINGGTLETMTDNAPTDGMNQDAVDSLFD